MISSREAERRPSVHERWMKYEGLLVVTIVVGMVLLALLERLLLPLFRH